MKTTNLIAAAALVGSFVAASPLKKREIVWITVYETYTTTIDDIVTLWVDAPHPAVPITQISQPTAAPAPAPAPVVTSQVIAAAPAPTQPASQPSAPSGATVGDITYYAPGLGSCGWESTASDAIVALSHDIMAAAAGGPNCGRTITISYNGVTQTAKVVDTCMGCDANSIDLSPSLFQAFAPLSVGRVSGVSWWFN